jgi:hypothetical protein
MTDHHFEALKLIHDAYESSDWGEPNEALFLALVHAVLDVADAVRES